MNKVPFVTLGKGERSGNGRALDDGGDRVVEGEVEVDADSLDPAHRMARDGLARAFDVAG